MVVPPLIYKPKVSPIIIGDAISTFSSFVPIVVEHVVYNPYESVPIISPFTIDIQFSVWFIPIFPSICGFFSLVRLPIVNGFDELMP